LCVATQWSWTMQQASRASQGFSPGQPLYRMPQYLPYLSSGGTSGERPRPSWKTERQTGVSYSLFQFPLVETAGSFLTLKKKKLQAHIMNTSRADVTRVALASQENQVQRTEYENMKKKNMARFSNETLKQNRVVASSPVQNADSHVRLQPCPPCRKQQAHESIHRLFEHHFRKLRFGPPPSGPYRRWRPEQVANVERL
jgi:hypothetical protein